MGLPVFSFEPAKPAPEPTAASRTLFSAKAVVSHAVARREMQFRGLKDLSDQAVADWRFLHLAGYESHLASCDTKDRRRAFNDLERDIAWAIRDVQQEINTRESSSMRDIPNLVQTRIWSLVDPETRDSYDSDFREGWDYALSLMPEGAADSICKTVGVLNNQTTASEDSIRTSHAPYS